MERFSSATDTTRAAAFLDASKLIFASAVIELLFGIVLIFAPSFVGKLLLGTEFPEIARGVARLAGIALVALVIACWPQQRSAATNTRAAMRALLTYNFLAAVYFCYWWVACRSAGPLLWLAVALHGILTAMFLRAVLRENTTSV